MSSSKLRVLATPGQLKITQREKQRFQGSVENNAYGVLETLVTRQPNTTGRVVMHGSEIQAILIDLTTAEINDAISTLEELANTLIILLDTESSSTLSFSIQ